MSLPLTYLRVPRDEEDEEDTRVLGVRVACNGETDELDVPKFQPMIVTSYDEVFLQSEQNVPDLTRFLGIPLAVRRIPFDSYLEADCTNLEVASLFRICNLSASETIAGSGPDSAIKNGAMAGGSTASSDETISGVIRPSSSRSHGISQHHQKDDYTSVSGTAAGSSSTTRGPSSRGTSSKGGSSRGGGFGRGAGGGLSSSNASRVESLPFPLPPYSPPPNLPVFPGFGGIPQAWNPSQIGPILLVRLDHKPLHPLHVAAITAFTTHFLRRPFTDLIDAEQRRAWQHQLLMAGTGVTSAAESASNWTGEADVFQRRTDILSLASQTRFTEFFEEYKTRRVEGRPDLLHEMQEEVEREMDLQRKFRRPKKERPKFKLEDLEPRTEWADVHSPYEV